MSGLLYYRARYYSNIQKRFISEDPIGLQGGINEYTYVLGNPVGYSDPSGLIPQQNVFPPSQRIHNSANNIPSITGAYIITGHGDPNGLKYPGNSADIPVETLAQMILNDKNYHQGEPVYLLACNIAGPYTQKLADLIGANVFAYSDYVAILPNGMVFPAEPNANPLPNQLQITVPIYPKNNFYNPTVTYTPSNRGIQAFIPDGSSVPEKQIPWGQ